MADRRIIDDFLAQRRIAVAGVSRNPHKFGNVLFRELKQRGYDVLPLNPLSKSSGLGNDYAWDGKAHGLILRPSRAQYKSPTRRRTSSKSIRCGVAAPKPTR